MTNDIATRIGYAFQNPQLLETALTHRSYYFENRASSEAHFERLEFLGDAVLDLLVSEMLVKAFPQMNEGSLSKWRASLVNETVLGEVARELELGKDVRLGKSEEKEREALRPRLLSSALEAVVAALYLDGGLECARTFIERQFSKRIEALNTEVEFEADFKTRLQEITQKRFHTVPEYRLVQSEGPEHAKVFTYAVYVNGEQAGQGSGPSRKSAEQEAARVALKENEL